jgi:NAD-dependent dihydropyrimidine dehydrogenase PreA subunit
MKMSVDASTCTGCGACVEVCQSGAISLTDSIAILDQAACTQCQACVDVCPVGAVTTIELPVAVTKAATIQLPHKSGVIEAEPVAPNPKPWLSAVLAFAGREILPRLAEALMVALDRRLASQPQASLSSRDEQRFPTQNSGGGYRRRVGCGQTRRRGRGQGHGPGKGNWF